MTGPNRHPALSSTLRLLGPPVVWALHFSALYAAQTVFCAWMGGPVTVLFILGVGAGAVALVLLLMVRPMRAGQSGRATRFVDQTGVVLCALSLCAIVWQTMPALILPSCVPPL